MQWHKESTEQAHHKAQIDAVFEVRIQIVDVKVQFVQMLVNERDQRLDEKRTKAKMTPNIICNEMTLAIDILLAKCNGLPFLQQPACLAHNRITYRTHLVHISCRHRRIAKSIALGIS